MISTSLVALFASASLVAGHGIVTNIIIDGKEYPGVQNWDAPANKKSPVRRGPDDNGFVRYDAVTRSMDIACSAKGYAGTPVVANIKAGGTIKIRWGGDQGPNNAQWPHCEGPELAYLAPCTNGDCTTFNPSNALWTKIFESGLDPNGKPSTCFDGHEPWGVGRWATNLRGSDNSWFSVTIPKDFKDGPYLFRHEITAMQIPHTSPNGGVQYYPSCTQIHITGGGSSQPKGVPATSLYTVKDGEVDIYKSEGGSHGIKSYKIPGPPLYVAGKVEAPPVTPSTTKPVSSATPTSTKAAETSSVTSASRPPTAGVPTSKLITSTVSSSKAPKPTPVKTSGKICKPKVNKRSLADETHDMYARALEGHHARRAASF